MSEETAPSNTEPEVLEPESPFKKKVGRRSKEVTFARPPTAKEIFTEDNARLFDSRPGYMRHFVKQYIKSGNLKLAAKQANIAGEVGKVVDEESAETRAISVIFDQNGLGDDDLISHLKECLEANVIIRDKHGEVIETKDLRIKMQALDMIFKLKGYFNPKPPVTKKPEEVDLFPEVDPESKSD